MKKAISLALSFVLMLVLSVSVFAADTLTDQEDPATFPGSSSGVINADYVNPAPVIVHKYVVTVSWEQTGTIKYTDTEYTYAWDSDNLEYIKSEDTVGWELTDPKIEVTVTNKSDNKVKVTCDAPVVASGIGVTAINGSYDQSEFTVDTAAPANPEDLTTNPEAAPSDKAVYTISDIEGKITEAGQIGTITVSIAAVG